MRKEVTSTKTIGKMNFLFAPLGDYIKDWCWFYIFSC